MSVIKVKKQTRRTNESARFTLCNGFSYFYLCGLRLRSSYSPAVWMPVTNRSTLIKPIRIPLQTGTHLTVNPVRMKLRLRLSVAGLSHDLMLCCSALFQCCPLIHNPRLLNPSPWWQLMTSCPDVLVIWESGGQLRHQWVTFVCVCVCVLKRCIW